MTWLDKISPQLHNLWQGHTDANWIEPARTIADHELVVVTRGACAIQVGPRTVTCSEGAFLIVPPDTRHISRCLSSGGVYRYCFHFDWTWIPRPYPPSYCALHPKALPRRWVRRAPAWVPKTLMVGRVKSLAGIDELMDQIVARWTSPEPARRASCRGLLLELLLLLLSPETSPRPPRDRARTLARNVRDLLRESVPADASIQKHMARLGYSYAHLCRAFRASYGVTPLDYLNAVRVERAKGLLTHSRDRVKEVADKAGFSHVRNFTRAFRRYTGVTPQYYRQRI